MTHTEFLTRRATIKKSYRDGLIDEMTYIRRVITLLHDAAGVPRPESFEAHADQAVNITQEHDEH